jgi:hypothetical protein
MMQEVSRKRRSLRNIVFIFLAVFVLNTLTYANMIYNFHIFNNPNYENDLRLNFTLTITDEGLCAGNQKIGFKFNNNSTVTSSITDIYFDAYPDCGLLNFNNVSIIEGPGVSFSKYASPKSLPGGSELTPKFDKTPEYSADSDSPVSHNGINPDEWLKLVFTLKNNKFYDDVIAEIAAGDSATETNLRIGIHIQSLPKDIHYGCYCPPPDYSDSASAINCTQPIPEPATIALFAPAVFVLLRRKSA